MTIPEDTPITTNSIPTNNQSLPTDPTALTIGHVDVHESDTYEWKILNFLDYLSKEPGEKIHSPEFSIKANECSTMWKIQLLPKGEVGDDGKYISLSIVSCNKRVLTVACAIAIRNNNQGLIRYKSSEGKLLFNYYNQTWTDRRFFKSTDFCLEAANLIDNGTLTVVCVISVNPTDPCNTHHSDIIFLVHDLEIYAHKIVMTYTSRVFAEYVNSGHNKILIKYDCDRQVFEKLIHYCYTTQVVDLEEYADELLVEACRYRIRELIQLCEEQVCNDLDLDVAISKFRFAAEHNLHKLKKACLRVFKANTKKLDKDPMFKEVMQNLTKEEAEFYESINISADSSLDNST